MKRFITPDLSDKRVIFASEYLSNKGFEKVEYTNNADFVLLGVNPDKSKLTYNIPIYAGNVSADNVFDYTKAEEFAVKNAYLTAEGALALAISESEISLINSSVIITGYGRIGKALHTYLSAFTKNITVCARSGAARALAASLNAEVCDFSELTRNSNYDYVFNTVPFPVFNKPELEKLKDGVLLIDLASFPGGIDKHLAEHMGIKLITAKGLPSKYSPESAGRVVGETVYNMIRG